MSPSVVKLTDEMLVVAGFRRNSLEHVGRQEGVVERAEQQRRHGDAAQVLVRGGLGVVVVGIWETVNGVSHRVVKVIQRARPIERRHIKETGETIELSTGFGLERPKKVPGVETGEAAFDVAGAALEVERYGDGGRRDDL